MDFIFSMQAVRLVADKIRKKASGHDPTLSRGSSGMLVLLFSSWQTAVVAEDLTLDF